MKVFIHLLVLFFIVSCAQNPATEPNACLENRSALDIGSGATKFKIFAVNLCEKKIISVLYEEDKSIAFKEDLEKNQDKKFSINIQNQLKEFLQKIQTNNKKHKVTQTYGVATEAFRMSANGREVIEEMKKSFNFSLEVISQEEEARLGFLSASSKFPEIRNNPSVVWDIGGGSMQMVMNSKSGMHYYFGKLASVSFKNLVLEKIKKQKNDLSPNPLSSTQVSKALKLSYKNAQRELLEFKKLVPSDISVIGVGGVFQHSLLKQMGLKDQFSKSQLDLTIKTRTGFKDSDFKSEYATTELTNLILVKGFMDFMNFKTIRVGKVNLTEGLVLSRIL